MKTSNNTLTNFDRQLLKHLSEYDGEIIGRDLKGYLYVTNSKGQREYLNPISGALNSLPCGCSVFVKMMLQKEVLGDGK